MPIMKLQPRKSIGGVESILSGPKAQRISVRVNVPFFLLDPPLQLIAASEKSKKWKTIHSCPGKQWNGRFCLTIRIQQKN